MICDSRPTVFDFYADAYRPLRLLNRAPATDGQYRNALRHWERFGGPAALEMIDDIWLARFAAWLLDEGLVPPTINKVLRHFVAILRFAKKRKVIDEPPEFTPLREAEKIPEAFLLEEFTAILKEVRREPGTIGDVPARDWFESLLLTIYDTGARIGAVLATSSNDVMPAQGIIRLLSHHQKQHRWQVLKVHPETVQCWRRIWSPQRPRMWFWRSRRSRLDDRFRKIVERAGIATGRGTGCLFHRIRRSTASYCKAAGGDPTAQLGHSHPSVTKRYLDPRIVCEVQAADLIPRPRLTQPTMRPGIGPK